MLYNSPVSLPSSTGICYMTGDKLKANGYRNCYQLPVLGKLLKFPVKYSKVFRKFGPINKKLLAELAERLK